MRDTLFHDAMQFAETLTADVLKHLGSIQVNPWPATDPTRPVAR